MQALLETGKIAAVIVEPVPQNIGIVKPLPSYLEFMRELCSKHGMLLVFDEVKTGFRHALGSSSVDLQNRTGPDCVWQGGSQWMPARCYWRESRIHIILPSSGSIETGSIAGTYNAHPFSVAAAIATVRKLKSRGAEIFSHLERLGQRLEYRL